MQQSFSKPYKSIAMLLIVALILPGCILPKEAHALTVEKMVTKYHLDIGVEQVWGTEDKYGNIIWDDGIGPGGTMNSPKSIPFPKEVYNVKAYPYSASKFNWEDKEHYTSNVGSKQYFDDNYLDYASSSMTVTNSSSNGNIVSFSYSAKMSSIQQYDLTQKLNDDGIDQVFRLMAGPYSTNPEGDVQKGFPDLYNKLNAGRNGVDPRVHAYMYFTPVIIQYDVKEMVEIGSIDADLNLPTTAKTGESYDVADNSNVDDILSLNDALLEKRVDGGAWQTVTTWKGTGEKGKNTGGSITEKSDEVCNITYRITINASDGQTDTAEKTIYITDGREISGKADLILDEYTYEGHPADAFDESNFKVDGVDYSAKRAYEEKVASSSYKAEGGSARKETATSAIVTFPKRGVYPVTLNILTSTGQQLSDTENIEVRKTPYIIDSLGGFQKQNRKQVLSLNVATYPDKPITDYYIKIKDKVTGQDITLTEANPQVNNATIKTRAIVKSGDKYWTNFVVEFLTKTPRYKAEEPDYSQNFEYTVWVKDSKGDTDMADKVFAVVPDKPPFADITMQDTFLRAEGTNTAEILAEDSSSSDGDQLLRTWSVDLHNPLDDKSSGNYVNAKLIDGYKNLAFGTDQKIGFNKEGVGKATLKLHVKDVWNQATLPEYITPEDYLEGETTKTTTVTNIAPIVSINPIFTDTANIIIMADYASKGAIESKVNTLKTQFLEKNIDANIQVVPVTPANNEGYKEIGNYIWNTSINCPACQTGLVMDSEYVYRVQAESIDASQWEDRCIGKHTIYAMKPNKEKTGTLESAWSYTVDGSSVFKISIDSAEKYLFVDLKDKGKTIVLNRSNGAYLTTLAGNIDAGILSSDGKRMYTVEKDSITRYDFETGISSKCFNKGGSLARLQNGKIIFVGQTDCRTFCIYTFDMNTESVTMKKLPVLQPPPTDINSKNTIEPVDMDINGKVVFTQTKSNKFGDKIGMSVWLADLIANKASIISFTGDETSAESAGLVKDESGRGKYVYTYYTQQPNSTIYEYLNMYEFTSEGAIGTAHGIINGSASSTNGIVYAQYHTDENAVYIMQGSDFNNLGYRTYGFRARINVSNWSSSEFQTGYGWDVADELAGVLPSKASFYYRNENWHGTSNRIKVFNNSLTKDQSDLNSVLKYADFKENVDNFLLDLKGDAENLTETIKVLKNAGVRFVETTEEDMKDLVINVLTKKEEPKQKLAIKGDAENIASMAKEFPLEEGNQYYYTYDEFASNSAIDLFHVNTNRNRIENDGTMYGEIAGYEDFSDTTRSDFFKYACSNPAKGYTGLISELPNKGNNTSISFSFNMEKDGYLEYNFLQTKYYDQTYYDVYHNGKLIETTIVSGNKNQGYTNSTSQLGNFEQMSNPNLDGFSNESRRLIFLKAGKHDFSISSNTSSYLGVTKLKVVYLSKQDNLSALKSTSNLDKNGKALINGSFSTPKSAIYKEANLVLLYEKDLIKEEYRNKSIYPSQSTVKISDYLSVTNNNSYTPLNINAEGTKVSASNVWGNKSSGVCCSYEIKNPYDDKMLLVSYNLTKSGMSGYFGNSTSTNGKYLENGKILLPPNGYYIENMDGNNYRNGGSSFLIENINVVKIPLNNYLGFTYNTFNVLKDKLCGNMSLKTGQGDFYELDLNNADNITITKYYEIGGNEEPFKSQLSFNAENLDGKEVMISNFKLFTKENGKENILLQCGFNSLDGLKDSLWKIMSSGNGSIEMKDYIEPKHEEEEPALVYKKGELVRYNINYSDYENDPSKCGYWLYAHTPYNDGENPQASIIYDEDGNIKSICGQAVTPGAISIDDALNIAKSKGLKILNKPIDRFYVDGKYTVYHWQFDDTSRGKGGYPLYDKASNMADLTFYVEGSATAPWITGISTSPAKVTENNYFSINVGIDDVEKDILNLTTEVYKDKKHIFTHRKKNIYPIDAAGNTTTNPAIAVGYPVTNTGALPDKAQAGTYEVVCTVRDQTGAGIGTYKFVVVSEGKIIGHVYHTEQWDINRKKYNLNRFKNEINRSIPYAEYVKLKEPRTRGTNVFWSGEKFMLNAEVAGTPTKVTCSINGTTYVTTMKNSGKKNTAGESIYTGNLWDKSMINKWGRKEPIELTFTFTAYYSGETTKKHDVRVIVDNMDDYWKLHRAF